MFSFSKKIVLCLLLLTACISVYADDIYTLDSIEAVWYDNTRIAHERLDSLGRREKANGWKNCKQSDWEITKGMFYLSEDKIGKAAPYIYDAYKDALKEGNHHTELRAIMAICSMESHMGHLHLLSRNAQLMKNRAQEVEEEVESSHYYESTAYQFLSYCICVLDSNMEESQKMLDSAKVAAQACPSKFDQQLMQKAIQFQKIYNYQKIDSNHIAYHEGKKLLQQIEKHIQNDDEFADISKNFQQSICASLMITSQKLGYTEEAEEYYLRTLEMMDLYDHTEDILPSVAEYLALSEQWDQLVNIVEPMLETSHPSFLLLNTTQYLMMAYQKLGMKDKLYPAFERYATLMDSIREAENDAIPMEINTVFNTNELENALKSRERLLLSNKVIMILFILLILSLIGIIFILRYRNRQRMKDNEFLFNSVKNSNKRKLPHHPTEKDTNKERSVYWQVIQLIEENDNYRKSEFSIKPLEKQLLMRSADIEAQFEKECGISLSDTLLHYRLRHACELLENTDYILEVVAEESGFGSSRTFYRQFRNAYNLTPNAYRTMSQEAKNNQETTL